MGSTGTGSSGMFGVMQKNARAQHGKKRRKRDKKRKG
jgi:hypothetical protein